MNEFLEQYGITNYTISIAGFILLALGLGFWFYKSGGFGELKKIWYDININPATGRYSQKRMGVTGSYFLAWFICFTQAFDIKIHPVMEFNSKEVSIWIPVLLFLVALGQMVGVLQGYLNNRKTHDKNGNPLEPAYTEPVYTEEVPEQGETTDTTTGTDEIKEPITPPSFAPKRVVGYKIKYAKDAAN